MSYWRTKETLVTGGCGNIGSYLVEQLVQQEANVTVVDNLESGDVRNLNGVKNEIEFINADLINFDTCVDVSKTADVVFNLAGRTHGVGYSDEHHGEMLFHNTVSQFNVLEAARRTDVERVLVTSSSCIYPDDAPVPTPEFPTLKGHPEEGNEGYGWAKRMGELQGSYYHNEYDIDVAICRPFNIYSPRYVWRGEDNSHVIPALVKRVLDGEDPLTVWGSGNQKRNFLHAYDAAQLMLTITKEYACADPVNIGFEDEVTIQELVTLICDVANKNPEIEFDTSKPEGSPRKCADSSLLRRVSDGYTPKISLREGIQEMIDWYRNTFSDTVELSTDHGTSED